MSLVRIVSFSLAGFALSLLLSPVVLAEENHATEQHQESKQQRGASQQEGTEQQRGAEYHQVSSQHQETEQPREEEQHQGELDRFRIKRDYTPRLYGGVEHHKELEHTHACFPVAVPPCTTMVNTFVAPAPIPQQLNYIWEQSANGGYYDASGQVKELVMGDQLFRYGGKFSDGSSVPSTPVVCNFQGHVYRPYVVKR